MTNTLARYDLTFFGIFISILYSCKKEELISEPEMEDTSLRTKFSVHIRPLLNTHCGECHSAGTSQTNYLDYDNSKNAITSILDRIQREEGASGFMPRNGNKLPQESIDLIQQWQDEGLIP